MIYKKRFYRSTSDYFLLVQLKLIGVYYPEESCNTILTFKEWLTLYMRVHQKNNTPNKPP
jgi:hypothetical protein